MADLSDGEYLLANIQWRKRDEDSPLRPLRGFTSGKLIVNGSTARVKARFTDQNLSNRFSNMEMDGVRVVFQVSLLGEDDVYLLPGRAPSLERAGACYVLRLRGRTSDVAAVHAPA